MNPMLSTLQEIGQEPVNLGGRVLVLPFGGRIIGLYPREDLNCFWVNPALESMDTARSLLGESGWANLGGDRTWISPEVDTNVGDPAHMAETYDVPKAVDPGAYQVAAMTDKSVTVASDMRVRFHRSNKTLDLTVSKNISLLNEPPFPIPDGVDFSGYMLQSRLESRDLAAGVFPALWHLVQVPGGGRIVIPVADDVRPRAFIGNPSVEQAEGCITCSVVTAASFKFSLHAKDCRGLLIYLKTDSDIPFMVVRELVVHDEDLYADVPCDDSLDTGHVQQVYVDDGALGGFGELEYHTPALGKVRASSIDDISSLWTFAGSIESLTTLFESVLSRVPTGM